MVLASITIRNKDEIKTVSKSTTSERLVKNIRRKSRKIYSTEEKIRIVLDGLRGEMSAHIRRQEKPFKLDPALTQMKSWRL